MASPRLAQARAPGAPRCATRFGRPAMLVSGLHVVSMTLASQRLRPAASTPAIRRSLARESSASRRRRFERLAPRSHTAGRCQRPSRFRPVSPELLAQPRSRLSSPPYEPRSHRAMRRLRSRTSPLGRLRLPGSAVRQPLSEAPSLSPHTIIDQKCEASVPGVRGSKMYVQMRACSPVDHCHFSRLPVFRCVA